MMNIKALSGPLLLLHLTLLYIQIANSREVFQVQGLQTKLPFVVDSTYSILLSVLRSEHGSVTFLPFLGYNRPTDGRDNARSISQMYM